MAAQVGDEAAVVVERRPGQLELAASSSWPPGSIVICESVQVSAIVLPASITGCQPRAANRARTAPMPSGPP